MKFYTEYNGNKYEFESGAEAYIFHTGIYNEVPEERLLKYVAFVFSLYLKDSNRTPLGELADYIAENWDKVQGKDRCEILDVFYYSIV
ncbi:hypothetical protein [Congzhengia minquanensis]|uniref:Uncharacterized protein n=1 Tax=Congzhengia minquanensis TaxID=2763657 RepID=A0A926HUQ0_9FIRM|nr:hypothetical protein [Congzhengia minquanensis]MBC8540812.1 hypothetical protein [Congzhengia minquanensis]